MIIYDQLINQQNNPCLVFFFDLMAVGNQCYCAIPPPAGLENELSMWKDYSCNKVLKKTTKPYSVHSVSYIYFLKQLMLISYVLSRRFAAQNFFQCDVCNSWKLVMIASHSFLHAVIRHNVLYIQMYEQPPRMFPPKQWYLFGYSGPKGGSEEPLSCFLASSFFLLTTELK